MLAPILDRILYFNLGAFGRQLVALIENNKWWFIGLFLLYGGVVFYAKVIWSEYLPKKMQQFVKEEKNSKKSVDLDKIYQSWLIERKKLPKYILVPSHNELWVKTAAAMTGMEQKLFYNSDKKKMTEKECLAVILEEK